MRGEKMGGIGRIAGCDVDERIAVVNGIVEREAYNILRAGKIEMVSRDPKGSGRLAFPFLV